MTLLTLLLQTLALTLLLLFILALTLCLSNLYLHSLSPYPGPILGRATRLYWVYHKLRGNLPFITSSLHAQYGPIVRLAPDELSYTSSGAWQDIFGHRSGPKTSSFEKEPRWYSAPRSTGRARSIVNAGDEDHRRMRKLQSHAFSERALGGQEPILRRYVELLVRRLGERVEKGEDVVDLVRWYNFATFDLIGDLAFGRSFGCLESGEMHFWIGLVFGTLKVGNVFQALRFVSGKFVELLMGLVPRKLKNERGKQFAFAKEMAAQRISEGVTRGDGREDFMSYILRANDEKGMTVKEIEEAANIYIIAGSETTATLLSGVTYLLLRNPPVMEKLVKEVRGAFGKEEDIQLAELSQLAYLNAVLEEGLRMFPPVPSTMPRVVPAGGEFVLDDYLPAGTVVGVNQWAANYSADNFARPKEFLPERWLGEKEFENDDRRAMQPFSFGPRNCIGKNLAYNEMRLILSRVLWKFDLELQAESEGWAERQKVFILWEKGPLMVKLRPRGTISTKS